jgi:uncharacterized membrane protein YphA (DoxX/SURF4 family)
LAGQATKPGSREIPFERERLTKKQKELAGQAAGWMNDAAALGQKLVAEWDAQLPDAAARGKAAAAAEPTPLWKGDRFVSWSLVTIGACLVLGLATKFNAMGGVFFLASVIATQPFWVPGAQATYDQWVELAAPAGHRGPAGRGLERTRFLPQAVVPPGPLLRRREHLRPLTRTTRLGSKVPA